MKEQKMTTTQQAERLRCGFCFDREQGTHGEVKREWSPEWLMFIPVCRKHALADGMIDGLPHETHGT